MTGNVKKKEYLNISIFIIYLLNNIKVYSSILAAHGPQNWKCNIVFPGSDPTLVTGHSYGGDMASTWVAKLKVHAEAQITS